MSEVTQDKPVESTATAPNPTPQENHELNAFKKYIEANREAIPEQFGGDAAKWFASLKNSQAEYTKSRQEIAELKKAQQHSGEAPKETPPPTPTPVETKEEPSKGPLPQLTIKEPDPTKVDPPKSTVLSDEDILRYEQELAIGGGKFSEETRKEIANKGIPPKVLEIFEDSYKSKLEKAYTEATQVVGSRENLDNILTWAESLDPKSRAEVRASLASPAWKITLLGLKAQYESSGSPKKGNLIPKETTSKPMSTGGAAPKMVTPYTSKAELTKDRLDPKYATDPKFRDYVNERMMNTDFSLGLR